MGKPKGREDVPIVERKSETRTQGYHGSDIARERGPIVDFPILKAVQASHAQRSLIVRESWTITVLS